MEHDLQDVILPNEPLMLRWRQSDKPQKAAKATTARSSIVGGKSSSPESSSSKLVATTKASGEAQFFNFTTASPPKPIRKGKVKAKRKRRSASDPLPKSGPSPSERAEQESARSQLESSVLMRVNRSAWKNAPSILEQYSFSSCPYETPTSMTTSHYINYYLHGVSSQMYQLADNLSFNPIRDRWFYLIMTDETWFYTVVYVAAKQLEKENGAQQSSQDASRLMDFVFGRIKDSVARATRGEVPPDSVIGAVSCIVSLENALGNKAAWRIHANGLAELVRAKGGIYSVDRSLLPKITRAEIEGPTDSLTVPLLPSVPPSGKTLKATTQAMPQLLGSSSLDPTLTAIAKDIFDFANLLSDLLNYLIPIDPVELDEHLVLFLHRLLSYKPPDRNHLSNALKIAAILFIKALMRPIDVLPQTSTFLATQLRQSMSHVRDSPRSLTLWINFMGLLASKEGAEDRAWFLDRILVDIMVLKGRMCAWDEMREDLGKVFWVGEMFDGYCATIWTEVERGIITSRISEI